MTEESTKAQWDIPPWRFARRAGTHISVTAVDPARVDELAETLKRIDGEVGRRLQAAQSTHFFRWTLFTTCGALRGLHEDLPAGIDEGCEKLAEERGEEAKPRHHWLVMTSNFDGNERDHLTELVHVLRDGEYGSEDILGTVYGHCPDRAKRFTAWRNFVHGMRRLWWLLTDRLSDRIPSKPTRELGIGDEVQGWVDFWLDRAQPADLYYDGHLYRTVPQIRRESELWVRLQAELDRKEPTRQVGSWCGTERGPDRPGWGPRDVRTELQYAVATDEAFSDLLERPAYPRRPVGNVTAAWLLVVLVALMFGIGGVFRLMPGIAHLPPLSLFTDVLAPTTVWALACLGLIGGTFGLLFLRVFGDTPWAYWLCLAATGGLAIVLGSNAPGLTDAAGDVWGVLRVGFAGLLGGGVLLSSGLALMALARLRNIAVEQDRRAVHRPPNKSDVVARRPPDAREGQFAQNTMTHIAPIEKGRLAALRGVLAAVNLASRHYYQPRLNLGGIRTIHFGYWTVLEGRGKRDPDYLLFITNYDGSFDEYLTDFAKRSTYRGVNAAWGQCSDFPSVRRVFEEGANLDVEGFLDFGRKFQVPTLVWYSAYPHLTAKQINRQTRVRLELRGRLDPARTREWVEMLAGRGGEGP